MSGPSSDVISADGGAVTEWTSLRLTIRFRLPQWTLPVVETWHVLGRLEDNRDLCMARLVCRQWRDHVESLLPHGDALKLLSEGRYLAVLRVMSLKITQRASLGDGGDPILVLRDVCKRRHIGLARFLMCRYSVHTAAVALAGIDPPLQPTDYPTARILALFAARGLYSPTIDAAARVNCKELARYADLCINADYALCNVADHGLSGCQVERRRALDIAHIILNGWVQPSDLDGPAPADGISYATAYRLMTQLPCTRRFACKVVLAMNSVACAEFYYRYRYIGCMATLATHYAYGVHARRLRFRADAEAFSTMAARCNLIRAIQMQRNEDTIVDFTPEVDVGQYMSGNEYTITYIDVSPHRILVQRLVIKED